MIFRKYFFKHIKKYHQLEKKRIYKSFNTNQFDYHSHNLQKFLNQSSEILLKTEPELLYKKDENVENFEECEKETFEKIEQIKKEYYLLKIREKYPNFDNEKNVQNYEVKKNQMIKLIKDHTDNFYKIVYRDEQNNYIVNLIKFINENVNKDFLFCFYVRNYELLYLSYNKYIELLLDNKNFEHPNKEEYDKIYKKYINFLFHILNLSDARFSL